MGSAKIVRASAGSGKTFRLVLEYLSALVADPASYRHILAVTFTNKATGEMKERIVQQLHALASGGQSPYLEPLADLHSLAADSVRARAAIAERYILHDYSHFAVMTIDRFFQNIIRSFLRELGISPDFNIELRTDSLLETAADALIELSASDEGLREWLAAFTGERMDESGSWDIRGQIAQAGAEVFGEEWARGGNATREELGLAMEKAREEARQALSRMRSAAETAMRAIHAAGLSVADFYYKDKGVAGFLQRIARGETVDYTEKGYVTRALAGEGVWTSDKSSVKRAIDAITPTLLHHLTEVCTEWDRSRDLVGTVAILGRRFRSFGLLGDISRQADILAAGQNIVPIARTNAILGALIEGNDAPFIFEKAGTRFTRFLIDEFQDTSRGQWENFVPLLSGALSQSDERPVLLVGDVKQSIYRWRGGDWQILARDAQDALGHHETETLDHNRRSLGRVVEFNNNVMQRVVETDAAALEGSLTEAVGAGYLTHTKGRELAALLTSAYTGHSQLTEDQAMAGYVTLTMRSPGDEGTDPVITRIEELQQRGYEPCDIAILVRRRKEAREMARMLLDHKAAHPGSPYKYDVVTAEALSIGSSPAVAFAVACLSIAADPGDGISAAVWNRYRGRPLHEALPLEDSEFLYSLRLVAPHEALQKVLVRYGVGDDPGQAAYVQAFDEQVLRWCSSKVADLDLLLKWWKKEGAKEPVYMPESRSAISIITVHAAKGLERKAVIVPWCSWPLAPKNGTTLWVDCAATPLGIDGRMAIGYDKSAAHSFFPVEYHTETVLSHIDSINLLYVALTRAREELHIYLPRRKTKMPAVPATIGDLITLSLSVDGQTARIGAAEGRLTRDDESMRVAEFGQPVVRKPGEKGAEERLAVGYPVRDPGLRVRMKMPARRYTEEGETPPELSPRSYGVLMHRVFEQAASREGLWAALDGMRLDGSLSTDEAAHLRSLIERALADPLIASWFDTAWDEVRNENDILVPDRNVRRPDRVMLGGGRAVVVDYKSGRRRDPAHALQVGAYCELLRGMGYPAVEGYVWYVSLGEVERIG